MDIRKTSSLPPSPPIARQNPPAAKDTKPPEDRVDITPRKHHYPDDDDDAKGMQGHRGRCHDGMLKAKRGDTHISSLEKEYGEFSKQPADTNLKELRQESGEVGIRKVMKKIKHMESQSGNTPPYIPEM